MLSVAMKWIILCTTAGVLTVTVRQTKAEFVPIVVLGVSIAGLILVSGHIQVAVLTIKELINMTGIKIPFLKTVLQITGLSYLSSIGSDMLKDCGETAIASKLEMGVKVIMTVMSLQILVGLARVVIGLMKAI